MPSDTIFWLFLITASSRVQQAASLDNVTDIGGPWSIIPLEIDALCPNTPICANKLDYSWNDDGGMPCCRGCSCEEDCGRTNSCCFPELDTYVSEINDLRSCQHPISTIYPDKTKTQPIQSFYMVDRCPGQSECEACGRQKVAEWGSLYPVFSKTTGLIYKNPICAACFNVTDGQSWYPNLAVIMDEGELNLENSEHILVSKLMDSKDMTVWFVPPMTQYDVRDQVCFKHLIDFCVPRTIFSTYGNYTDTELCESGLRAPIWYEGRYYANIFCALCKPSGGAFSSIPCSPENTRLEAHFTATIDNNFTVHENVSENPVVCSSTGQVCKEVHCPAGHQWYNNKCVLVLRHWTRSLIHVVLQFTPRADNLTSDGTGTSVPVNVNVTLSNTTEWEIRVVVTETEDATGLISHVYADVILETKLSLIPAQVLQSVEGLVQDSTCSIKHGEHVHDYNASFSRYTYLVKTVDADRTYYKPLWLALKGQGNVADEENAYNKTTTMVSTYQSSNTYSDDIPISISKMFFCPQVELTLTEFKSFYNGTLLLYKKTGQYFMDGEFTINKRDDGSTIARICVEHYDRTDVTSDASQVLEMWATILWVAGYFVHKQY